MLLNLKDFAPVDCGAPVAGLQPAIIDVTPGDMRPGSIWCPVLVDREAGTLSMPVPFRMPMPDAFASAIKIGQKLA